MPFKGPVPHRLASACNANCGCWNAEGKNCHHAATKTWESKKKNWWRCSDIKKKEKSDDCFFSLKAFSHWSVIYHGAFFFSRGRGHAFYKELFLIPFKVADGAAFHDDEFHCIRQCRPGADVILNAAQQDGVLNLTLLFRTLQLLGLQYISTCDVITAYLCCK